MKILKSVVTVVLPVFLSYMIIDSNFPWVMVGYAIFLMIAEFGYYLTIKRYGLKQGLLQIGVAAFTIVFLSVVTIFFPEYVPFMDLLKK